MFHWICPECGSEIPPAVRECAACDPKAVPVVQADQAVPEAVTTATAAIPEPAVAPEVPIHPLLALAEQVQAIQIDLMAEPVPVYEPALVSQGDPPSAAAFIQEPHPADLQAEPPNSLPPAMATPPAAQQLALLLQAKSLMRLLGPPASKILALPPAPEPISAPETRLAEPEQAAEPVPMAAARLPHPIPQPQAGRTTANDAKAGVKSVSAVKEPLPTLPNEPSGITNPPSGSWLSLAPLQSYTQAASLAMRPAAPPATVFTPDSGPRVTLPGPMLPPQLESFQDPGLRPIREGERRRSETNSRLPGWAVTALVMLVLFALGTAAVFSLMPSSSNADVKTAPPQVPAPEVHVAAVPMAQALEVTGFRIVVDFNKKSEIHYVVVNHSAAKLSDMTVYVTLRAASSAPGDPPLCRFSFRAPEIGPFAAMEMTSPIEKLTRSVTLPEWSELRSDVQVTQ